MDSTVKRLVWSAVLGLIATSPFIVMEAVYTAGFSRGVPFALFIALWLLASVFLFLAISVLRASYTARTREWIAPLLFKICAAAPVAFAWVHLVNDQMPCFLGAHGC